MSSSITITHHGEGKEVWVISIHRPYAKNAVDRETAKELTDAFSEFENDKNSRVAVLTGSEGTFCSGADLKAVAEGPEKQNEFDSPKTSHGPMGPTRMELSKPVIAAIEGFAVAGGLELALWADLRVVAEDAKLGVFCRRWGVPLIDGGTVRLPQIIGLGRAMDLILTGREVCADEALAMGLATSISPPGEAVSAAVSLGFQIAKFPQTCMRHDRLSVLQQKGFSQSDALANEFLHGVVSIKEAMAGAAQFARGAGRHGSFDLLPSSAPSSSSSSSFSVVKGSPVAPAGTSQHITVQDDPTACPYDAVLFDAGGVVLESPFLAIAALEERLGLSPGTTNEVIRAAGAEGAFAKLERGILDFNTFSAEWSRDCEKAGISSLKGEQLMEAIGSSLSIREPYLEFMKELRTNGLKTGILTNNYQGDPRFDDLIPPLQEAVDVVVESCRVGLRKPDPDIYQLACKELCVAPHRVIFLDDIKRNLKPARAMGMTTIHVPMMDKGGLQTLKELRKTIGLPLVRSLSRVASRGRR